ncbi:Hypothetical predicted protein [Cloeon dipterum]|uniref:Bee-milk protein n=1 Tax=Cloeon dipterum TaxID=197152 RepID=A0A8S1DIX2_9INSE|nr:Hypothetical predicted protein [Cloeon dipterum]
MQSVCKILRGLARTTISLKTKPKPLLANHSMTLFRPKQHKSSTPAYHLRVILPSVNVEQVLSSADLLIAKEVRTMSPFLCAIFLLQLSSLSTATNFSLVYEWHDELDYEWPSEAIRTQALRNGTFEPEHIEPRYMAVYGSRLFLSLTKNVGIPVTLVSLPTNSASSPKLTPVPSWDMHRMGDCNMIESASGLKIDSLGRLWVLDSSSSVLCNPKLWIIDLMNNDSTKLIHQFPENGLMNDLVLDETPNGTIAYISWWGVQHIVVFCLERNESWTVDLPEIDVYSIALSPKNQEPRQLYLGPTSELYLISVTELRSATQTANLKLIGKWTEYLYSIPYRMLMDNHGTIYVTFCYSNSIFSWNTSQPLQEQIFHEVTALYPDWPFTFALDENGTFWMTEFDEEKRPTSYRLLKAAVIEKSSEALPVTPAIPTTSTTILEPQNLFGFNWRTKTSAFRKTLEEAGRMAPFFVTNFLLGLSPLATAVNFNQVYQWKELDYEWPSKANTTMKAGTFEPKQIYPIYMAVYGTMIFLSLEKNTDITIPVSLVSLSTKSGSSAPPRLTPFPSWDMHGEAGDCDKIEAAKGLEVDSVGRLWVLDDGSSKCQPKLWIFDLNNYATEHVHLFPFRSLMQDLVLDETPDGTFAYISQWLRPHIFVFSLERNESWKVNFSRLIVHSITLSSKDQEPRQLYLTKWNSKELYSFPVAALRNGTRTANPKLIGNWTKIQTYRMLMDNHGIIYAAFKWRNFISSYDTSLYPLFEECRLHDVAGLITATPFTFALDEGGTLWMTVFDELRELSETRYRLLKAEIGAKSYMGTTAEL